MRFPDHVSRHTIDLREGIQGHQCRLVHQNAAYLLQQRNAFFLIFGLMLFVDQPVDFGVLKADALGPSRAIILVVNRVGINGGPPNVIKGNFAAVDSV